MFRGFTTLYKKWSYASVQYNSLSLSAFSAAKNVINVLLTEPRTAPQGNGRPKRNLLYQFPLEIEGELDPLRLAALFGEQIKRLGKQINNTNHN